MIKVPCYKCEDRVLGCHEKCEKYLAYKQAKAEEHDAEYQRNLIDATCKRLRRNRAETRKG